MKRNYIKWYVLAVLAVLAVVYFTVPAVRNYVGQMAGVLASADVGAVADYIRSYGATAAVISFALMVFSSVVAPLPAFLITFANAAIFGWWQGAILSWSSAMAGAALCFFLARSLGRDMVEKYGRNTILICRLLPFVSFDAVSYFAGLTPIGFWAFFWATGVGQLPATVVYSYVGGMLTGGVKYVVTALLCIFALSIMAAIAKSIYNERQAKKTDEENS